METKGVKSYDVNQIGWNVTEKSETSGLADGEQTVNSTSNLTDDVVDRANWSNPVEFILSCMNFAIGLGNVKNFHCC
jgi:hypothetical protein